MKTYQIAAIPGDGIGQEVVPAGQEVLQALAGAGSAFRFEFQTFEWGGDFYRQHGVMMPTNGLDALRAKDAILFGSAGDPHIPDHITLWGLRLKICQGFHHLPAGGNDFLADAITRDGGDRVGLHGVSFVLMMCALLDRDDNRIVASHLFFESQETTCPICTAHLASLGAALSCFASQPPWASSLQWPARPTPTNRSS